MTSSTVRSTVAGIVNLVDRRRPSMSRFEHPPLSIYSCKLITHFDDRHIVA